MGCTVVCCRSSFQIPELPVGQELQIKLLTTWGDKHYVGLNGIEVFTSQGTLASVKKVRCSIAMSNLQIFVCNGYLFQADFIVV